MGILPKFLSTPSARRATQNAMQVISNAKDFYPRPPRGGRRVTSPDARLDRSISIHALREEGDWMPTKEYSVPQIFLSTPSARRATQPMRSTLLRCPISIHALREEGDGLACQCPGQRWAFLSTPSARRATLAYTAAWNELQDFYPRPPRGGRQQKQRENPLLLSHYTPPCTNCKEVPVKQTAESHRYLCKRLVFRCEASGKTMCAACSHWRGIKRSVHYPAQTPGAAQHARP